ncbi:MAG: RNA-binding S4 domain-containing protein [Fusobacteria bacterium]|nr:RNA-binding S4 domain-containing protein [Fusobacteriota bacterium]
MRIDKYLKVSRLVKRRSVGKELCDCGKIVVNGKVIKGSYEVKTGDIIEVIFGSRLTKVKVLEAREVVKKEDVGELYELLESRRTEVESNEG